MSVGALETASFEEPGVIRVPEAGTAQAATPYQVFDKKVERASREKNEGSNPSFLTK